MGTTSHSFSCRAGGRSGTLYVNEGMPDRLKGRVAMRLETATASFPILARILPNEEAGSSGLEVALTPGQLAAAVNSPGQIHLVAGKDRIRVGLRGVEPHRAAFLAACGGR